jgi:hypothetical protein
MLTEIEHRWRGWMCTSRSARKDVAGGVRIGKFLHKMLIYGMDVMHILSADKINYLCIWVSAPDL